jgi:hypothetical protein
MAQHLSAIGSEAPSIRPSRIGNSIVHDDGFADESLNRRRVRRSETGRAELVRRAQTATITASTGRNLEIAHADGKYVEILDSDDTWLSDKISEEGSVLKADA